MQTFRVVLHYFEVEDEDSAIVASQDSNETTLVLPVIRLNKTRARRAYSVDHVIIFFFTDIAKAELVLQVVQTRYTSVRRQDLEPKGGVSRIALLSITPQMLKVAFRDAHVVYQVQ